MPNDYDAIIAQMHAQQSMAAPDSAPAAPDPGSAPTPSAPAPVAAPSAPANPYDDAVSQFHDMRVQASQAALYANRTVNPDQAAKAIDLGQQTGVPSSVVLGDMPTYQARAQSIGNAAILKADPALADWMASNPVAPQVASDDLANLSLVGQIRREITGGLAQGVAGNQAGRLEYQGQTPGTSPQLADLQRTMQASGPYDSGVVHWVAKQVGGIADSFAQAAPLAATGAVAGGGIGALATGVPSGGLAAPVGAATGAAVGGAAGFGAGMFTDGYKIAFGSTNAALSQVTDAAGNHLDPNVQFAASTFAGLVNGTLNIIGVGGATKAAVSSMVGDAVKLAVSRPTVASALGSLAGNLAREGGLGAAKGAGLGAIAGAANVTAEQVARMASGGDFATVLNDPAQRQQAVQDIAESMGSMAALVGVSHGVAPFAHFGGDLLDAARARSDMTGFQSLEQGAVSSATRTRSPSVFQDWMEQQSGGEGAGNIYVPAQRVADLYQRMGIQPDSNDGLLGPVAPDIRDQLQQGLPAGGDVVLPMSSFITHLAGSDVSRELQPDMRLRADGMSLNDAQAFQTDYSAALSRGGRDVAAQQPGDDGQASSSRDAIADDVFSQARQAGFSADAARQYGALFAARYATRGERLGVDPMDLYAQEGLRIQSADQPATPPAATPDNLDVLINALRSGRAEPPDTSPSLMQFLASRGGVVDQGGELSGVGADRWHVGKPGQRRFIRPADEDAGAALPGMEGTRARSAEFGLEGAAEAAHEAGYLPDAEPGTLVDAVRREVGGEPVRVQHDVDPRREGFRGAVDDLRNALGRMDIDPAKATNAEIRRALAGEHGLDGAVDREDVPSAPGGGVEDPAARRVAPVEGDPARVGQDASAAPVETITRDTLEAGAQTGNASRPGEVDGNAMSDGFHRPIAEAVARGDQVVHVSTEGRKTPLTSRNGLTVQAKDGAGVGWLGMLSRTGDRVEIRRAGQSFDQSAREPVARITGEEIAPRSAEVKDLRQAARAYFADKLRGTSVHSDALDRDVEFRSSRKPFNTSANPDKLRLFAALPDIIKHGELVSSEAPHTLAMEPTTRAYHYLQATVDLDGRPVRVGVTVREDANGHLYYNHNPVEEAARTATNPEGAADKAGPGEGGSLGADPQPAGTRRKGGPGTEDGSRGYEQNVGAPADGVNMTLAQPDGSVGRPGKAVEPRGSIRLSEGEQQITLFKNRNLSTLLHEAGHSWLDEMTRDAERPDAPQQVRDDMQAVLKWLGVDSADKIGTAEHETFARGAEAYLMNGDAPSLALRGAFQRFKAWLTRIYKSLSALRAPMDPAIKGVFDRLVASDDEIAQARSRQGLDGLFRSASDAGMTDAEFAAYTASLERVRAEAQDALAKRVMNDVRRQRTAQWRDEEAPIREAVTRDVDGQPAERALRLIRTGKLDDVDGPAQRMRLDRDAITDMYGSDTVLEMLPRSVPPVFAAEGGMHPDIMASMLGLRSGDELLQHLMQHEAQRRALREQGDTRSPRQAAIDGETYARMVDRHGDALQDGSIESDALDQLHNERQAEVLGAELRALGRRSGDTATPTALARQWAARTIGDKRVGEGTKPNVYARAEAKAGSAATKAMLAGDYAEAFRAKQQQLLNHALYMEAKAAKADVDRGRAQMERFGAKVSFPAIAPGYVDRIHDLLRRFEVPSKRNSDELDRALGKQTLEGWATQRIAEGREIVVAPDLYDGTYARPADTLSVNQFRDLAETVRSIAHVGREEQDVTLEGAKADRADVVSQMLASMADLPTRDTRDFDNQGSANGVTGSLERAGQAAGAFHAMLLKPEAILDRVDRDDPNGPFNKAVWRPIKAAQATEGDLRVEMVGRMRDLHDAVGKGYGKDYDRTLPDQPELIDQRTGQPMALKKRGVIAMALNIGSESNFDRLTQGYGWTRDGVQAALDRNLTAADWRYVQGIWDTFDSLFPRIEEMQRRMTGVGLEKVEPREVMTAHGPLKGGYFPVVYDPNLSQMGDRIRAAGEQRFEADYVRATTPKGHTISRKEGVAAPLSLNPDIIHWKLGQAIHDLAYREAIVQADKLLGDRQVIARMDETIGKAQRLQLDRWLQGVANAPNIDTRGLGAMDSFLHRLRINSMVVGIGFRATTMLKHGITALSNSIGELGPGWMMKGTTEFFGSTDKMRRNYAMITGKSAEMRQRFNAVDRDVRDALGDLSGKSSVLADAERFGHYGVATLDMLSALPTWLGAYRKGEAGGMEEADAVAFADKTVRNAHGAQGAPDLAAIQRGSEAQKLFTMFYGFFNHIYNRQAVGVRAAGSMVRNLRAGEYAGARSDFAKTLSTFTFYLMAPALIEGLVSTGGPSDDDSYLGWAAKQIAGEVPAGLPVMRDMAKAAIEGRGYEMSPVGHAVDEVVKGGRDLARAVGLSDKPVSDRWLQHAIEAPGYVLGLPTGQAAWTAQFLANVANGDEDPHTTADWLRGLIYGPAPKHPVH
jgi:hypothetical protein